MSKTSFYLVYDGPALAENTIDVRTLAPALLAMGDLVERTNEVLNQDQAKVQLNVRASFQKGSFGIELDVVQSLWQAALSIVASSGVQGAKEIIEWVMMGTGAGYSVMGVIRWLRGRGIKRVVPLENGIVRIYVDDEQLDIEENVLKLLRDYRIRKAIEMIVTEPLKQEGIDVVAMMDTLKREKHYLVVEKSESRYFRAPPADEEVIADDQFEQTFQVATLSFNAENMWRFTDGQSTFTAPILDDAFLSRVQRNQEKFAKDDIIKARVRRVQRLTKDGLKLQHEILEVLEHRSATPQVQLRLDFAANSDDAKKK